MDLRRYAPHFRETLALGLPLSGGHLARIAIGIAETVMIGWYGVEPLAALVLATSLFFLVMISGSGYGIAVAGILAPALAQGDETQFRRATRMALWLSALHAALFMPVFWWSEPIFLLLGQSPVVAAHGQEFLRIAGFSVFPALWGVVLASYLAALGRPNVAALAALAGLPITIFLNWVLIFGNLGAPAMGVKGAAISMLVANCLMTGTAVAYAVWLPQARRFALLRNFWRPDWPDFRAVLRLGLPVGLVLVAEVAMFAGMGVMMGWIGTVELAAHGIALQLTSIPFMIQIGLANAATLRIGRARGHGDVQGMRDASYTVLVLSVVMVAISISIFVLMPRQLLSLYLDPADPLAPSILSVGVVLMFWAALFQLFDGLQAIMQGFLRGVQDTRVPLLIGLFSYWGVGLPMGYLLAFVVGFGAQGLWMGLMSGLVVAAVLLGRRFFGGLARGDWTVRAAPV